MIIRISKAQIFSAQTIRYKKQIMQESHYITACDQLTKDMKNANVKLNMAHCNFMNHNNSKLGYEIVF